MVRPEPARRVMVPDATLLAIGILNTTGVGMSGAVTSTTTVATAVPERSACTISVVWAGGEPVGSCPTHEPRASMRTRATAPLPARAPVALGADGNRRGPSGASSGGGYRGNAGTHPGHQSGSVYGGNAGVISRPRDGRGRRIPVPVLDHRC